MIRIIERGQFFFIGMPGASANYIHVDNVVNALIHCASLPQAAGRIFNLSDYATLESFVEMIAQVLGRARPRVRIPEQIARLISKIGIATTRRFPLTESRINAMTTRATYPIDLIQQTLGYRHKVTMEEGVARLCESRKSNTHGV